METVEVSFFFFYDKIIYSAEQTDCLCTILRWIADVFLGCGWNDKMDYGGGGGGGVGVQETCR